MRGKIQTIATFGSAPAGPDMPAAWKDKVMHVRMTVGDQVLMGSDRMPGQPIERDGFAVAVLVKDPAEADRIFAALSNKATGSMPIQETFFARRFGMLTDQFGVPWMVNCEPAGG